MLVSSNGLKCNVVHFLRTLDLVHREFFIDMTCTVWLHRGDAISCWSFLSIVFLFSGLFSASGLIHSKHQIVIHISHSHSLTGFNDHHQSQSHSTAHERSRHDLPDKNRHIHEVSISCGHSDLSLPPILITDLILISKRILQIESFQLPHELFLDSLFRPPILA